MIPTLWDRGVRTAAWLSLAFFISGGKARADVITYITALDNLVGGNVSYGYNAPILGTGFHSTGGCPPESGGVSCTISYVGTMDASGNLTSVSQTVTMTGSAPAVPIVGQPAYSADAGALALANLSQGIVGVSDSGDYLDIRFPESGQGGGSSTSFAQNNDTVHFTVAGASPTTVTDITVSFTVDGLMTVPTPAGDSHGYLQSILNFGTAFDETDVNSDTSSGYNPVLAPGAANGWVSEQVTGTPGAFTFTGVYALTGESADLGIAETLSEQCGIGTSCDYSHTGVVSFDLPSNVSFTSDDGFLSQPVASTPEPGSLALFGSAAGLLALIVRKRAFRRNASVDDQCRHAICNAPLTN